MKNEFKVNFFYDNSGCSFEKIVEIILKDFVQENKKLHISN